ncbi:MAG: EFR1 family ferrodoxin [Anaerorhabdus sp.]
MILYFSATGNSEYVSKRICEETEDQAMNLLNKIREHDYSNLESDKPWIIVAPTYSWRIPRILYNWIEKTTLLGNKDIYFIMTCAGSIGNSEKYLNKLCHMKNMNYRGCFPILMPENYIALFSTPSKEESLHIIELAEVDIDKTIETIKKNQSFPSTPITIKDQLNSGIINDMFYPLFVSAKKFYATDKCISCGKCVTVCPLNNIHITDKKPVWENNCTHCMACINRCPVEAIEYGNRTKSMMRYTCPK